MSLVDVISSIPILYFSERSSYRVPSLWCQSWHLIPCPCCEISHLCCFHLGARWAWIGFPNFCYEYHILIVVLQKREIFKFYVQYSYCFEPGQSRMSPWLCMMLAVMEVKQFGCSLERLWTEEFLELLDQDGVNHFLNHPEVFLTVPKSSGWLSGSVSCWCLLYRCSLVAQAGFCD